MKFEKRNSLPLCSDPPAPPQNENNDTSWTSLMYISVHKSIYCYLRPSYYSIFVIQCIHYYTSHDIKYYKNHTQFIIQSLTIKFQFFTNSSSYIEVLPIISTYLHLKMDINETSNYIQVIILLRLIIGTYYLLFTLDGNIG